MNVPLLYALYIWATTFAFNKFFWLIIKIKNSNICMLHYMYKFYMPLLQCWAISSVAFFLFTQHAEMTDESVQLKTLQTILIVFQSHLHPESEVIAYILFDLPRMNYNSACQAAAMAQNILDWELCLSADCNLDWIKRINELINMLFGFFLYKIKFLSKLKQQWDSVPWEELHLKKGRVTYKKKGSIGRVIPKQNMLSENLTAYMIYSYWDIDSGCDTWT